jgi:mannosyltransferase
VRRVALIALFLAVLAVAAFLRFDKLGAPSYWLDEILGDMLTTHHAHGPWWHWLTGLEREHGSLYYAAQLAARAFGPDEFAGRLPAALFGLAAIPLVFLAARVLGGWAAGAAAAIVLAVSPLHVYYSREARPYALLMLLTAVLLWALLQDRFGVAIAAMIAMVYTSAVAGPLLLAIAITLWSAAAMPPLSERRRGRRTPHVLAGAATIAAALVPLLYRGEAQPSPSHFDESVFSRIAGAMTVSARGLEGHELTVAFLFLFATIGAVALWRRDKGAAAIVLGVTLLPIVCALASLAVINHWFAIRYVSPALIGFVVLAAVGMTSIRLPWAGVLVAAVLAADTWSAARREPFEKLDWRAIGAALERHVQPGDAIVTAEPWSDVCLRYYLRRLPPRVRVASVNSVMLAEMFANAQPTWFVTAGEADPTPVRDAICRYPLLAAGELEGFRLHYAPSLQHFVQHRAAPEDLRALAAALGASVALHSGRDDELFRGDGWQGPEGRKGEEFRWATAKEASLLIPRLAPRGRRVVVHALPLAHRALPPQTMTLSINGTPVSTVTMPFEWRDYAFDAPAKLWREGLNTLTFTFGRVTIPATLGAPFSDPRPLAVAFESVSILESSAAQTPPPVIDIRLASNALFRTRCALVRKHAEAHWREDAVKSLYARLGFDPDAAWRELRPEDAATAIAIESACESDRAFLDRAFYAIAERNPNPGELADLIPRLQHGAARVEIVGRVLKAIDVRQKLTRP